MGLRLPTDVWINIALHLTKPADVLTCLLICRESCLAVEQAKSKLVKPWMVRYGNQFLFEEGLPLFCLIDNSGILHGPWLRLQSKVIRWYV